MPRLPRRPSAATVLSLVALLVALGGTGYAAANLPAGSVGTKQLRDGAVRNAKLHDGSVSTAKLQDSSVGKAKLKDGSVSTAKLKDGAVSTEKLAAGAVTSGKIKDGTLLKQDFATGVLPTPHVHKVISAAPAHDETGLITLSCTTGEHVIASGWEWQSTTMTGTEVTVNRPGILQLVDGHYEARPPDSGETPDAWVFLGRNYGAAQKEFTGYIVCE